MAKLKPQESKEPASLPSPYSAPDSTDPKELYLHLLKLALTGLAQPRPLTAGWKPGGKPEIRPLPVSDETAWQRYEGEETWPADAFTMIGMKRLDNIQACVEDVLQNDVPGHLIETGVWRGGATIFMRALLKLHGVGNRIVYVADSFQGLPPPDAERYPADGEEGMLKLVGFHFLAVSLEEVKANFRKFDLLDDQVRFVAGWFRDTLPSLSEQTWSVIRMDGDFYESTIEALENLYPNLSVGGYLIIDDYGAWAPCQKAVADFRQAHDIQDEIQEIDFTGAFWQKTR